jgi:hypothetical protein
MKKLIAAAALAMAAASAQANIIPILVGDAPTANGDGTFSFTYQTTLASDQALRSGDFFTIYDFAGFTGFGTLPTGWMGSTANVGPTPPNVMPRDDPAITNISFTYTGPDINYPASGAGVETNLGTVTAISTFGGVGLDFFAGQGTKNQGVGKGTKVSNIGQTAVPISGGGSGQGVPEPSSWAMLLAGFGLLGMTARRSNRVKIVTN